MSWWGYLLMSLNTFLIWGLIIAVIVALFRYVSRGTAQTAPPTQQQPTPEQVLAERFARGEIDEEEYRHRREVLRGRSTASQAKP